jgi:hypothetical protein
MPIFGDPNSESGNDIVVHHIPPSRSGHGL